MEGQGNTEEPKYGLVPAVDRAVSLLRLLQDGGGGHGVSELSRRARLHKSTVHDILHTLCHHRLVEQDPITKRFRLAAGLLEFSAHVRERINVVSVSFNGVGYNSLRTFQRHLYRGRIIGSDYGDVNLAQLAEVYGAPGERVTDPRALGPSLRRMLDANRPAVLDVMIDPMQEPPRFFEIRKFLGLAH